MGKSVQLLHLCFLTKYTQDTAGQERYRTITNSYYRGAHGIFIVYDVCRQETFDALPRWIEETEHHCNDRDQPVVRYIVGNKIDEKDLRVVSTQTALDFIEPMTPPLENDTPDVPTKPRTNPYFEEFKAPRPSSSKATSNSAHIDGYFEVSAKSTDGVRNMFVSMVEQIIESGALDPPLMKSVSRLGDYSTWSMPSIPSPIDLSKPLINTASKCYASSC